MCGIAGFSLNRNATAVDRDNLTRALLLGIEPRGRDATGVAWHGGEYVWFAKDPVRASDFVEWLASYYSSGFDVARSVIAHTRFATQGSPDVKENNHPIDVGGLVGVHNGCLTNDDAIFAMLDGVKRRGTVDSEAAFALLANAHLFGEGTHPADVLPLVSGSAALAWMDADDPAHVMHLARCASSPLVVAQSARGNLLFASTREAIRRAEVAEGFRVKYMNDIPEGTYLEVRAGRITDVRRFEPGPYFAPRRPWLTDYSSPSRFALADGGGRGKVAR